MSLLLFFACEFSYAQQSATELNQQELMKKFIGSWQVTPAKDTIGGIQFETYGEACIASDFVIIKGVKTLADRWLIGYSKADDNFRMFGLYESGGYVTRTASFVSENKFVQLMVRDFDTSRVYGSVELVLDTPASMTAKFLDADGNVTGEAILVKSE